MIPIVTPEEMTEIDRSAAEPVEVLIERAGAALARAAVELLGGTYGRRVVVVAGKGNNGNDGRAAAERLRRRGVRVVEVDAADSTPLPGSDIVIDAAYGTGFRGEHHPVAPAAGTPVLAVDIPSGLDGVGGTAAGEPLPAARTVTFAALKPGLLLGAGPDLAGDITVADIGLDTARARAHLVEAADVAGWLPARARDAHKWQAAAWVVAGSAGMLGAAHLCSRAAQRAGAGYVRLSSPGVDHDPLAPTEAVLVAVGAAGWDADVLAGSDRFGSLAVGPGLGTGDETAAAVRATVAGAQVPVVVDGDGLTALAITPGGPAAVLAERSGPIVLTPHEGEFARLAGEPPAADRLGAVRALAAETGAVVLLKGSTTVVADPGGTVLVTNTGDARLATAGTGDVLTGVICALLAQQVPPLEAAAAGAFLHGRAGAIALPRGLVAGDLVDLLPLALAELPEAGCPAPPPCTPS